MLVGGRRYGKGSSREHAPLAHLHAGVRLIVAESFERIFRQNADNLGLFTSTDFGLIERIRRGEPIGVGDLVKGRDALAARLLTTGGLLKYGRTLQASSTGSASDWPMTLVEGKVWLASPPTVAASAIGGRLMSFQELIASRS